MMTGLCATTKERERITSVHNVTTARRRRRRRTMTMMRRGGLGADASANGEWRRRRGDAVHSCRKGKSHNYDNRKGDLKSFLRPHLFHYIRSPQFSHSFWTVCFKCKLNFLKHSSSTNHFCCYCTITFILASMAPSWGTMTSRYQNYLFM